MANARFKTQGGLPTPPVLLSMRLENLGPWVSALTLKTIIQGCSGVGLKVLLKLYSDSLLGSLLNMIIFNPSWVLL